MSSTRTREPGARIPLKQRRGLLVAVAAFAVASIAGLAALMLQPGSDEIATPTTEAVVTILEDTSTTEAPVADPVDEAQTLAVVLAYEAAEDIDVALALVADDAVFSVGGATFTGKDEIREWMEASEDNITVEASNHRADGTTVRWHAVVELLGDTVTRNVTAVVEDGLIQNFNVR